MAVAGVAISIRLQFLSMRRPEALNVLQYVSNKALNLLQYLNHDVLNLLQYLPLSNWNQSHV